MKKVLLILSLSGLLSVLLVPLTASVVLAAPCPANQTITTACQCGANNLIPGGGNYCDSTGTMRAGSPSGGVTTGGAPTVFSDVAGLKNLIDKIGDWVFIVLMAVAGTFLIVAGLMWVTAGGNPEKVNKARQMLVNALIGVAIGLLARGIVMVIDSIIRG